MQRKTARFTMLLFAALLFTAVFMPWLANAADFDGTVKLEGEETFSLTADELRLFDLENIAPGDVRTGKLHIENTTNSKMECRILSIMSYSKDKRLFNAMKLRITDENGTELYTGPYGGNGSEPLVSIPLNGKQVKALDVEVTFPSDKGNEYQATKMDSIWTFEARVFDASTPSDNGDKDNDKDDDNKDDGNKGDDNKGHDNDNGNGNGSGSNSGSGNGSGNNSGGENGNGNGGSNSSGNNNGNHSEGLNNGNGNGNSSGTSEQGSGNGAGVAKDNGRDTSWVKTGLDLTLSNSGLIIGMVLVGLCFLAAIVTAIRIYDTKRKRKDKAKK